LSDKNAGSAFTDFADSFVRGLYSLIL